MKIHNKILSLLLALSIIFSSAVPVFAADDVSSYNLMDSLWDVFMSEDYNSAMGNNIYDFMKAQEFTQQWANTGQAEQAFSNGNVLTTPKKYWARPGSGGGGRFEGDNDKGYVTDYTSGETSLNPIVTEKYNTTNNNYNYIFNFGVDIDIDIDIINYNTTYNTYEFITPNLTYYVAPTPTYVSIMYYDTNTQKNIKNDYYYQLPDGRNSYDLTADEVWGTYFIYNALNYSEVVEDDGVTLGLWHFDQSLTDSSANKSDFVFTQNASYAFVGSSFNDELYLAANTKYYLNSTLTEELSNDFTIEGKIRIPATISGMLPVELYGVDGVRITNSDDLKKSFPSSLTVSSGIFYNLDSAKSRAEGALGSGGTWTYTRNENTYVPSMSSDDYYYTKSGSGKVKEYGIFPILPVDSYSKYSNVREFTANFTNASISVLDMTPTVINYKTNVSFSDSSNSLNTFFKKLPTNDFYFALVRENGVLNIYINGVKQLSFPFTNNLGNTLVFTNNNVEMYFDEIRVSNKALYSNTYTPRQQPFDTNLVLVLPENGTTNDIAVKSNTPVTSLRVGGVRPTLPVSGDVYVYLEDDIVKDVQQYQTDGWYSVDAAIYEGNTWVLLKDKDLSAYNITEEDFPTTDDITPTPSPTPDGGTDDDNTGDDNTTDEEETTGLLSSIMSTISNFITGLLDILFGGILDLITVITDNLTGIIESFRGIIDLLGALFGFLPDEMTAVLTSGLAVIIICVIIKIFI